MNNCNLSKTLLLGFGALISFSAAAETEFQINWPENEGVLSNYPVCEAMLKAVNELEDYQVLDEKIMKAHGITVVPSVEENKEKYIDWIYEYDLSYAKEISKNDPKMLDSNISQVDQWKSQFLTDAYRLVSYAPLDVDSNGQPDRLIGEIYSEDGRISSSYAYRVYEEGRGAIKSPELVWMQTGFPFFYDGELYFYEVYTYEGEGVFSVFYPKSHDSKYGSPGWTKKNVIICNFREVSK